MIQLNLRVGCLLAIVASALLAGEVSVQAAAKPTILLNITNHRKVGLVELHATADGESSAKIVGVARAAKIASLSFMRPMRMERTRTLLISISVRTRRSIL